MKGMRKKLLPLYAAVIVLFWTVLYLPHLGVNPRWYGDETITLACGQDLAHGIFANRGTWNTYVNPQFCYQPGYVAVMGAASLLGGRDLLLPRLLNAMSALAIGLLFLFVLGSRFSPTFALLGALTFLSYLQSVIHFRWVYAHNFVAAGFFFCFAILCLRKTARNSWLAGCGLAVAAACHPLVLHGGFAAFLSRWRSPRSWIPLFLPPLLAGLAVIVPVFLRFPGWFIEDIGHLAAYYKTYSNENASGLQIFSNLAGVFSMDAFHMAALPALIFLFFTRLRPVAIGAGILILALTANRQNLPIFYYQVVVVLPLLATAVAFAVWRLRRLCGRWRRAAPFVLPLLLLSQSLPPALTGTLVSRNDPWVTRSIPQLLAAVEWINRNTSQDDLVIAHWNTGWLLRCRTADLLQATAFAGLPTHTFEHKIPRERFRYSLSPEDIKFMVIGDIDQIWTMRNPNVLAWMESARIGTWPVVFQSPTYFVLRNPAFKDSSPRSEKTVH